MKKPFNWSVTRLNAASCLHRYYFIYRLRPLIEKEIYAIIGDCVHRAINHNFRGTGAASFQPSAEKPFFFQAPEKLANYGAYFLFERLLKEAKDEGGIYWDWLNIEEARKRIWQMLFDFYQNLLHPIRPTTILGSEYKLSNVPIGQGFFAEANFDCLCRYDDNEELAIVDYSTGSSWGTKRLQLIWYSLVFQKEAARSNKFKARFGSTASTYIYHLPRNEWEKFDPSPEDFENTLELLVRKAAAIQDEEFERSETDNCRFCRYRVLCLNGKYSGPAVKNADTFKNQVPPRPSLRPTGRRHFPGWETFGTMSASTMTAPIVHFCGDHPGEPMVERKGTMVCPQQSDE